MDVNIEKIYLSLEQFIEEKMDLEEESTDVIVRLENGEFYIAAFFAYRNINNKRLKNQTTGEYLGGQYFWQANMVLIENCSLDLIKTVIEHIVEEGDFYNVFRNI